MPRSLTSVEIGDGEVARIRKMHEAWTRVTDPQRQVQVTRARLEVIGEQLAAVKIAPGGRAHAVDRLFESTFLPSDLVRTQLRLALHYESA